MPSKYDENTKAKAVRRASPESVETSVVGILW